MMSEQVPVPRMRRVGVRTGPVPGASMRWWMSTWT